MDISKIEDYSGKSGFDRDFLVELARRLLDIWGQPTRENSAMSMVWILANSTIVFRDGFGMNDPSDLNSFPGVSGASAIVASLWSPEVEGWLEVERRYRPKDTPPADSAQEVYRLLEQAAQSPDVVLVD